MELKGTIKNIGETQTIGSNGFKKRELVLTTDEQYPQHILIEFIQDKTEVLNKYKVGQAVKIGINIRGREWTNPQGETKYFNSIHGWRIDVTTQTVEQAKEKIDQAFKPAGELNEPQDDLPF